MKKEKTTFETIEKALETMRQYITVQDNEINQYARICVVDNYKKDNYKIMKDFAVYYNRVDSYKISVADSTLIDCKVFKETHKKTDKTKALEFTVKKDDLFNTVCEILAQRLLQTDKSIAYTYVEKTTTRKASSKKSKQTA